MADLASFQLSQIETTCGSLLCELKNIWDDIGETDAERDQLLLDLEQECLEIYRKKVDQANRSRAQLRQVIADYEAELAAICSAMGEIPVRHRQNVGTLKEELNIIVPQLEEMKKRKRDRKNQFLEVLDKIRKISIEIGQSDDYLSKMAMDEIDLSTRKLEDLYRHLDSLQNEKSDRLKRVLDHLSTLNSLCAVLGIDFKQTVCEVHPSLDKAQGSNVSIDIIEKLASEVDRLRAVKLRRMQKLQDLAASMLEMWNLMDTPIEDQQKFQHVTCNIAASEQEKTEPNSLSEDFINYVEAEVLKLEDLKASRMKELVLKKKTELEELRRRSHLVDETNVDTIIEAIEMGTVDPALALEQIEFQLSIVKEESFSRKDVLERVEKWLAACEEESWLEEYNRDENRYNAGRGTHLTLKRAEKARAVVNKIPGLVEALVYRITSWEKERGIEFTYDGVGLLAMLEDYVNLRQEKEQERKRQRDQKKLQGQLIAEQEVLFGSKPSSLKTPGSKKMLRTLTMGPSRRQSLAGATLQNSKPELLNSKSMSARKADGTASPFSGSRDPDSGGLPSKDVCVRESDTPRRPFTPLNTENSMPSTPSYCSSIDDKEEFETPKVPSTPATVSAPMQMADTPAPDAEAAHVRERSFEERRLETLMREVE